MIAHPISVIEEIFIIPTKQASIMSDAQNPTVGSSSNNENDQQPCCSSSIPRRNLRFVRREGESQEEFKWRMFREFLDHLFTKLPAEKKQQFADKRIVDDPSLLQGPGGTANEGERQGPSPADSEGTANCENNQASTSTRKSSTDVPNEINRASVSRNTPPRGMQSPVNKEHSCSSAKEKETEDHLEPAGSRSDKHLEKNTDSIESDKSSAPTSASPENNGNFSLEITDDDEEESEYDPSDSDESVPGSATDSKIRRITTWLTRSVSFRRSRRQSQRIMDQRVKDRRGKPRAASLEALSRIRKHYLV